MLEEAATAIPDTAAEEAAAAMPALQAVVDPAGRTAFATVAERRRRAGEGRADLCEGGRFGTDDRGTPVAQARATSPEAVLEAAAQVFLEKGYRNATLDDIAARAGVSKPTVYRYAEGKQWLMDRIVKKVQVEMQERGAAVWQRQVPVQERLRLLIVVNVELAFEFRTFFEAAYAEYRESSPQAADDFRAWARSATDSTRDLLAEAVEAGVLDLEGDLGIYANLLQGMFASLHRWVSPGGRVDADEFADYVLRLLSAGRRTVLVPGG